MPFPRQSDWRVVAPSALFSVLSVAAASFLAATGLVASSDIPFPQDKSILMPPLVDALSKEGRAKAKALANYAVGYHKLRTSGEFSEDVIKRLLETVREDPKAQMPLKLLFAKWVMNSESKKLVDKLLPIAKKNPTAIDLNVLVANYMRGERSDEALELLETAAAASEIGDESPVSLRERIELANAILEIYAAKKRWSDGEDFCNDFLADEDAANSFRGRLAVATFLSKCADQGPDGFFSGWSKRRRRRSLDATLSKLDQLASEKDVGTYSLLPLLKIYKRYSMPKRAEKLVLNKLVAHPRNFAALVLLAKTYDDFDMHADAARAWRVAARGADDPRAVDVLRTVLKDPKAEKWICRYREGLAELAAGWYDDALHSFDSCLFYSPGNISAMFQMAYAYMMAGKNLKAIKKLTALEKILPDASYLKAICLDRIGKSEKAFDAMSKAETNFAALGDKADPPKDFWLFYADLGTRLDKRAKTEAILKELIAKYPDDPSVNNFLGYVWADWNKNLEQAEKMIEKALKKEPENGAFLDSMAWVLYRKGKYDDALEYIEKALEKDTIQSAVVLDHAGDINAALGDEKEAIRRWKEALETDDEDFDRDATREKIAKAEAITASGK